MRHQQQVARLDVQVQDLLRMHPRDAAQDALREDEQVVAGRCQVDAAAARLCKVPTHDAQVKAHWRDQQGFRDEPDMRDMVELATLLLLAEAHQYRRLLGFVAHLDRTRPPLRMCP